MKKRMIILSLIIFLMTGPLYAQSVSRLKEHKKIALTFDLCMTGGMLKRIAKGTDKSLFNSGIIEFLQKEKISSTIFITGLWAQKYPEFVKEMADDPLFEIGNHSYSHRSFTNDCFSLPILPEGEKESDLLQSQEILTRLTGKKPLLLRFPGGCYHQSDLLLAKKLGLKVIGWTFASGDAFNSNTEAIVQNVLQKAKSGAIVVFHLSGGRYAPKTEEVIKKVVPELRKLGYEFVTITKLNTYQDITNLGQ